MDSLEDSLQCPRNCSMGVEEKGQLEVVVVLRIIMATLRHGEKNIIGAFSIVASAIYRRTACNPKIHPIFVLSIVDTMLSIMWITGSIVWLEDGRGASRIGCFAINLLTVILQCVSMNVTLIYALLAYSSIRQKDFSGAYMGQSRQTYVHVWPPRCSFTAYFIAWTLPILLLLASFAVLSVELKLIPDAETFSCWCMPFYGNVLPRPGLGYDTNTTGRNHYLHHLHFYVASYSTVLALNFAIVFVLMVLSYCRVLHHIKRMRLTQERNQNSAIYRATQAMILEGQKDAKKRVLFFITIYFVTGITTFTLGVVGVVIAINDYHTNYTYNKHTNKKVMLGLYIFLLCEAGLVPLQGFLNAVAYGWTRGDFLSVMSTNHHLNNLSDSLPYSYGSVNRSAVRRDTGDEDEEEHSRRLLIRKERKESRTDLDITPGTPEHVHT